MVISHIRGHEIYNKDGRWYYCDNDAIADDSRPCKHCGRYPTPEGHDACLGHIDGVTAACCGHGISPSYIKHK